MGLREWWKSLGVEDIEDQLEDQREIELAIKRLEERLKLVEQRVLMIEQLRKK